MSVHRLAMQWLHEAGWLFAGLFVAAWLFSLAVKGIAARLRLARHRARQRRAIRGEQDAERLLERRGFTVLETQVAGSWTVWLDDQPVEIELQADVLVERDGEVFVAEVKTGQKAPSIRTARTRRQLLEYHHAFDVDGVVLVDMEAGTVSRVSFGRES